MYYPEGTYSAMLTAFTDTGELNEDVNRALVDMQIQGGLDGIFPVSSSGESILMDFQTRCRLMDIVMDEAKGRVAVLPGIPGGTPEESLALAEHARKLGCQGVVLMPPYFYKPSSSMLLEHLRRIIQGAGMPVVLYNIPLFTVPIPPSIVFELAKEPNLVGMKDSSGSIVEMLQFMDAIDAAKGHVHFLTGREEALLACLHMGGKGCMTATCAVLPEYMSAIYKAWKNGETDRALHLQRGMVDFTKAMMSSLPFPAGFKLALEARGFDMGAPRIPLGSQELNGIEELKAEFKTRIDALLKQVAPRI